MTTHTKFNSEDYLHEISSIDAGKEPDQYLKKMRFWLIRSFEGFLKKGIQSDYVGYNLSKEHPAYPIEEIRQKYDNIAGHYANMYRGGYLFNYFGFALAVIIASFAFAVLYYKDELNTFFNYEYFADIVLIVLGTLKLLVIMKIIGNTHDLKNNSINLKHIDFRYVAERLRFDVAFAIIGEKCKLSPNSGRHLQQMLNEYTGFLLYRDKVLPELAQIPLQPQASSEDEEIAYKYLIDDQMKFHESRKTRHITFEYKLKSLAEILNKAVLFIVILDLLIALCHVICHSIHFEWQLIDGAHTFTSILVMLTIIFPACVAALVAVTAQSEYGKLSARNNRLMIELSGFIEQYKNSQNKQDYFASNFSPTVQKLMDEVTEWTLIYEKEVHEM